MVVFLVIVEEGLGEERRRSYARDAYKVDGFDIDISIFKMQESLVFTQDIKGLAYNTRYSENC